MRAIIIPLNEYFFNHQKYDGKNPVEGFIYRRPWLYKFIRTKHGGVLFKAIAMLPLALIGFLFFLGPIYLYHLIVSGKKAAKDKVDSTFAAMDRWEYKIRSKDIRPSLEVFEKNKMHILVYFNDDMIPVKAKERTKFFLKMETMKQSLKVHHVFRANIKEDVEAIMQKFEIDPSQSFFMSDGKINLTECRLLTKNSDPFV